jgi:hypothetical protein
LLQQKKQALEADSIPVDLQSLATYYLVHPQHMERPATPVGSSLLSSRNNTWSVLGRIEAVGLSPSLSL